MGALEKSPGREVFEKVASSVVKRCCRITASNCILGLLEYGLGWEREGKPEAVNDGFVLAFCFIGGEGDERAERAPDIVCRGTF